MKQFFSILLLLVSFSLTAQKVESIEFHLYTDSLKKGVHNYINVDGKLSNGSWQPLSSKEITFTSSAGVFEGNNLIIPLESKIDSVVITATSKSNAALTIKTTIWIKKKPDPDKLPTLDELNKKNLAADTLSKKTKRTKNK